MKQPYYKNFGDLPLGSYTVKKFLLRNSKFGLKLLVEVGDFYLTLPKRFIDKINTEELVAEINKTKWQLTYGGRENGDYTPLKIDFSAIAEPSAQKSAGGNGNDGDKADGETDGKADGETDGKADGETDGKADGEVNGASGEVQVSVVVDDDDEEEIPAQPRKKRQADGKNVYPGKRNRI